MDSDNGKKATSTGTMNVLAFIFFFMAALWMLFAILYALSVAIYLHMRSSGRLREFEPTDPRFGRVFLYRRPTNDQDSSDGANFYPYIPMGPIFRMFMRQNARSQQLRIRLATQKVMTREERCQAMAHILQEAHQRSTETAKSNDVELAVDVEQMINKPSSSSEQQSNGDDAESATSTEKDVCAICLSGYGEDQLDGEACTTTTGKKFSSFTCVHSFHHDCLLEWLSRPSCVECPCCRVPMVEEEIVWRTVRHQRRANNKNNKSKRKTNADAAIKEESSPGEIVATGTADESEGMTPVQVEFGDQASV